MTLDELITKLTELRDENGVSGETLIMFAHQPNYPLQCGVYGPVFCDENTEEADGIEAYIDDAEDEEERLDMTKRMAALRVNPRPVVYLLEGTTRPWYKGQELSPYASRDLWDLC